jgi:hypothetical protein
VVRPWQIVIEAKCRDYTSVSGLKGFVQRECGKWVRRAEAGAGLSSSMVTRLLSRFLKSDLSACLAHAEKAERESRRFWSRVLMAAWGVAVIPLGLSYLASSSTTAKSVAVV